jgi:hypothetical protein
MLNLTNEIKFSDTWTSYDHDSEGETVNLVLGAFDMPSIVNETAYQYAVGICVYSRNYQDEWTEPPYLFSSLYKALSHYRNELTRLGVEDDSDGRTISQSIAEALNC